MGHGTPVSHMRANAGVTKKDFVQYMNWVDNHSVIITAKYGLYHFNGYGENAFSLYKSMGAFCCHGNQTKRLNTIILTILIGPNQHSYQIRDKSLQWLWRSCYLKVLIDRQTDDEQKVITIVHPEHTR